MPHFNFPFELQANISISILGRAAEDSDPDGTRA
jgi:hypothetical protein